MKLIFIAVLLVVSVAAIWLYGPSTLPISDDFGIYLYSSGAMGRGIVPSRVAFDINSGSIAYMIAALPMRVAEWTGYSGVVGFRAAAVLVTALVITTTGYLACTLANSFAIGATSSALMLLAHTLLFRAANGLEPKATMLLFGLFGLLALQRRAWFWSGMAAMAAGLAWRPGWVYLGVVLLVGGLQSGSWQSRARALQIQVLGVCVLLVPYLALFASQDALGDLWTQTMLAPVVMGRGSHGLTSFVSLEQGFIGGYGNLTVALPVVIGGLLYINVRSAAKPRSLLHLPTCAPGAVGLFLAEAAYLGFVFIDYQSAADLIPALPAFAIAAAWTGWAATDGLLGRVRSSLLKARLRWIIEITVLFSVLLVFLAHLPNLAAQSDNWEQQERAAKALAIMLSPDRRIVSLGNSQLLYFINRTNFDHVINLHAAYLRAVQRLEPGGVRGYVKRLVATDPDLVVVARVDKDGMKDARLKPLALWLRSDFVQVNSCLEGDFYFKKDVAALLFPLNMLVADCFKRE